MKTITRMAGIIMLSLLAAVCPAEEIPEDAPVVWPKEFIACSNAAASSDIHISDLHFVEEDRTIRFSFTRSNLMAWQPTEYRNGELVYSTGTPKATVVLFLYSKRRGEWVGNRLCEIPLGIEWIDMKEVSKADRRWAAIEGKLTEKTPMMLCFVRKGMKERSGLFSTVSW